MHEPPTTRSFYFSLTTTALRWVIVVALVVGGAILIRNAFPGNASAGLAPSSKTSSPAGSPSASHSPSPSGHRSPSPSPQIHGVVVAVQNGTATAGLAATTTQLLQRAGYTTKLPQNAALTATTFVYYRSDTKAAATYLRDRFFPGAKLAIMPSSLASPLPTVQIVVVLGADFASGQIVPSSSP